MAEERLIDEDKDRKYKIRKNADGEDELYIDDSEEPEESEEPLFVAPDEETTDEELMTPEQIAAREKMLAEEQARLESLLKDCAEKAGAAIDGGDYHAALQYVAEAEEADANDGEICALRLVALTCGFTDFSRDSECGEAAELVKEHVSAERKAELKELATPVYASIVKLDGEIGKLEEENEDGKSKRRVILKSRRKTSLIAFGCVFVPFVVFVVLAAVFGSVIHAVKDSYTNLYLTIIFGALAAVMFIALLVVIHKLWTAMRNVRLNESDTSTKLGRKLLEKRAECELLKKITDALEV